MKLTKQERQQVADTKALAKWVAAEMPQPQVPTHKPSYAKRDTSHADYQRIEQSYSQLDGEWLDWLLVAQKYESKVPSQDRYDVRHDILIELARARARDGEPIPTLRAYRIASFMVASYWRERLNREVKVCIYNGVATEPNCASCRHKPKGKRCPYQAYRPVQSLDQPTTDYDGYESRLLDTLADDNAIDLDQWLDAKTFRLGCPYRLIKLAVKRRFGILLNDTEQRYFTRQRAKELKRYQIELF